MDGTHGSRLCQTQDVRVAAEVPRMVPEALATKVRLAEPVHLEHRPHGAVEDDDPVAHDAR